MKAGNQPNGHRRLSARENSTLLGSNGGENRCTHGFSFPSEFRVPTKMFQSNPRANQIIAKAIALLSAPFVLTLSIQSDICLSDSEDKDENNLQHQFRRIPDDVTRGRWGRISDS